MRVELLFRRILFPLFFCLPVLADTQYLLEMREPADLGRVAGVYQLGVLGTLHEGSESVYLVSSLQPLASATITLIRSEPSVREFELNTGLSAPEADKSSKVQPSLDQLAGSLTRTGTTTFFGSLVKAAYVDQPATDLVRRAAAQQLYATGAGIVAIIDTGVDPNHPALKNALVAGYDFTRDQPGTASELADLDQSTVAILEQSTVAILENKNYPAILNQSTVAILEQSTVAILEGQKLPVAFGHGTMVAGLVHLIAPTARIMPLKAFKADGSAKLSDIVRAIYYATDQGAKVINMSFNIVGTSADLKAAVAYALNKGVILVASAGNAAREATVYPASYAGVIGVGSTNNRDVRSGFSNYGTNCSRVAAPGEALITTYPGNNYAGVWGTSFSSALVAGAQALFHQIDSKLNPEKADEILDRGVRIEQKLGDARLDLYQSIRYQLSGY